MAAKRRAVEKSRRSSPVQEIRLLALTEAIMVGALVPGVVDLAHLHVRLTRGAKGGPPALWTRGTLQADLNTLHARGDVAFAAVGDRVFVMNWPPEITDEPTTRATEGHVDS